MNTNMFFNEESLINYNDKLLDDEVMRLFIEAQIDNDSALAEDNVVMAMDLTEDIVNDETAA